jgi:hypothetical protein
MAHKKPFGLYEPFGERRKKPFTLVKVGWILLFLWVFLFIANVALNGAQ